MLEISENLHAIFLPKFISSSHHRFPQVYVQYREWNMHFAFNPFLKVRCNAVKNCVNRKSGKERKQQNKLASSQFYFNSNNQSSTFILPTIYPKCGFIRICIDRVTLLCVFKKWCTVPDKQVFNQLEPSTV